MRQKSPLGLFFEALHEANAQEEQVQWGLKWYCLCDKNKWLTCCIMVIACKVVNLSSY